MQIDFKKIEPKLRYKLLSSTIIPRPIALVSTRSRDGVDNAAPYSFFNVFSEDPPIVILGLQHKEDHSTKDTTRNIHYSNAFAINLIDQPMAKAMNNCAFDFPPETSEFDATGLTRAGCVKIDVKRVAQAPVTLECRRKMTLQLSNTRDLCIGEVVYMHIRDDIIDPKTYRINIENYGVVARLFADYYADLGEPYTLERTGMPLWYDEWIETNNKK
jgi:flavin reductase (DIM6/NTAB) family NADH-FMN oxidoreductase RutF